MSDVQGLYLLIYTNGSKHWRFRRTINGKTPREHYANTL
ncbi:Arm DNA-binding domain-containing protein [Obesumbacterium proteus]